jgi:hypothetical protein
MIFVNFVALFPALGNLMDESNPMDESPCSASGRLRGIVSSPELGPLTAVCDDIAPHSIFLMPSLLNVEDSRKR